MSSTNRCAVLSVVIVLTAGLASAQEATPPLPASQPATDRPDKPVTTQTASTPTTQPIKPVKLKKLILDLGKGVKMELVLIPAGKFMMGSPEYELEGGDNERPQHLVTFAKPFYMGIYEVTQEQWQAVMGSNPSVHTEESSQPVDSVTWADSQDFCKKLSAKTCRKVRLPSEAEWEYACRAGTTTRFYYGDDLDYSQLQEYAWYDNNSRDKTHPVGLKKPNAWGLYDMYGNVWELCQDWHHSNYMDAPTDGSSWMDLPMNHPSTPLPSVASQDSAWDKAGYHHVIRGGTYECSATSLRSAYRVYSAGAYQQKPTNEGFRVVVQVIGE